MADVNETIPVMTADEEAEIRRVVECDWKHRSERWACLLLLAALDATRAERDAYEAALLEIKIGKTQADNENPMGEYFSMAMRFHGIASTALAAVRANRDAGPGSRAFAPATIDGENEEFAAKKAAKPETGGRE